MSKQKITFESEGLKVVGNLFRPQNAEKTSLPAVLVTGAMTGVKEQVAGSYAERIAKAGFVTLVFDHRHFGESEGEPRQHEDPAKKIEDLKNAVSFMSTIKDVDRERIGVCGISMGGGYMLQLAAFDRRVKAVSIVASGLNLGDTLSEMLGKEGFVNFLKEFNKARQKHYETGEVQYIPAVATDNKPAAMTGDQPFAYYGTSRAWSPGWVNRYTTESIENLMSYNAIPYVITFHLLHSLSSMERVTNTVFQNMHSKYTMRLVILRKFNGWIQLIILTFMTMKNMLALQLIKS